MRKIAEDVGIEIEAIQNVKIVVNMLWAQDLGLP